MDGFGDSFVPNGGINGVEEDPAAEFLAREQSELAGIDDIPVAASDSLVAPPAEPQQELDFLAGEPAIPSAEPSPLFEETAAPVADAQLLADDINTLSIGADVPVITPSEPIERVVTPVPRIEPEPIRLWREEHQTKLVEKDAAEESAKEALREKAKQELVDWYKQHDEQTSKTRHANRCAEKELLDDAERPEPGAEWERISKLCDFGPKSARNSRDVSRMRSIILQVKQNPPIQA